MFQPYLICLMMNKQQKEMQKRLAKILVLMELLTGEIDTPLMIPTRQTKELFDDLKKLQKKIDPMLDRFYNSKGVSKSTIFNELAKKFEYNFNRVYK